MTLQIPFCYRLLISLAFFLSTVACLPASAGEQPVNQGPGITVKWEDLDLNTDGGRRALLDRLSKAARSACAFLHGDVGYPKVYGSCYDRTLATAVDKIHDQQLSTLFAGSVAAKDHEVIVAIHVSRQGLDLTQSAGAHQFYTRLRHAARVACTHGNRVDLAPAPDPEGCYEKALGDAIRSANVPLLTQVYLETHTLRQAAARGIDVPAQMAAK